MKNCIKINIKSLIIDFIFITVGFISLQFYNKINFNPNFEFPVWFPIMISVAIAISCIVVYIFPIRVVENKKLYENRKAMFPFLGIVVLLFVINLILDNVFKINNFTANNFNRMYVMLLELGISLSVFSCYFFEISLKSFNWNISIKSFALVVIVYIVIKLFLNYVGITKGTIHINNIFNINFLLTFTIDIIKNSVYPGFFEEVLYRGFLVSGLKGLGVNDNKANIIQAASFGIFHIISFGAISWLTILSTSSQAMLGYILGKIYFKTKSLGPCILLHGLLNAV